MPDFELLTYRDLAARLGIGVDSARIKAKRRSDPATTRWSRSAFKSL